MVKSNTSNKLLEWRYNLVARHIEDGEKILDLGAGTGWVGKTLQQRKYNEVHLVDVLDCNETDLPLIVYDGSTIPYDDNSFDVTTLIFVLHHAENQEEILKEAMRVSRRRIVVVEDTPRNIVERGIDVMCDSLMSWEHGFYNPATYRKIEEWREIFSRLKMKITGVEQVKPFFPFYYTKAVFVLDLED
jgi:ubiquinone/menaquinone biosynthesis C-methylase UbiE